MFICCNERLLNQLVTFSNGVSGIICLKLSKSKIFASDPVNEEENGKSHNFSLDIGLLGNVSFNRAIRFKITSKSHPSLKNTLPGTLDQSPLMLIPVGSFWSLGKLYHTTCFQPCFLSIYQFVISQILWRFEFYNYVRIMFLLFFTVEAFRHLGLTAPTVDK